MDQPLVIRELKPEEIGAAVRLWEACDLTRPWNEPYADARRAIEGLSSAVFGGFVGQDLAATAMVGADGHRAWVYYLAVSPDRRGAGHGKALMRASEDWARERGMPKLELMVRDGNEAADFYGGIGYRREPVSVYSTWLTSATKAPAAATEGQ
ncbi:MAG TPA: GNAT family acetyltransferase [Caulobacteraceae bacterium]